MAYNSCRNRHCPKCQASAAHRWLEARQCRCATGRVLPCRLYIARRDQRDRLVQQGGVLRPAVRRCRRNPAHYRRRPKASGRADRRGTRGAHVGLGAHAPSSRTRHRSRRRPLARR
ncbi:transposase zinc-binding domain-containing protein [Paraburkholderia strydomiana]|uniref:transposase zinc-binding domain-containing protein n=1 Tax=Paraburkholderia strydomiana TaxID=1245417 RepID=UPI0038B8734B